MTTGNRHCGSVQARHSQRGVVLIVGLILLFLVTLVALAGMRDTLLQERMAGNARDRDIARQSAEAALRAAESSLQGVGWAGLTNNTGIIIRTNSSYLPRKISSTTVSEAQYWTDPANNSAAWGNKIVYSGTNNVVAQPAEYVIEQLPFYASQAPGADNMNYATNTSDSANTPVSPVIVDDPAFRVIDYLITARGYGQTASTVVVLQSQYRRVICNPTHIQPDGSCKMTGTCLSGATYPMCW